MLPAVSRPAIVFGPFVLALLLVATPDHAEAKRLKLWGGKSSAPAASAPAAPSIGSRAAPAAAGAGAAAIVRATRAKAGETTETSQSAAAEGGPSIVPDSKGGDYYSKRAQHILEHEGNAPEGPHPLAAAHPGMDVTVCEAGCTGDRVEIVYMQPTTQKPAEQADAAATPAQGDGTSAAKTMDIVCTGGCYDTPRVIRAAGTVAGRGGDWISSVTPTSATGSGSGAWMKRIDAAQDKK